MVTETETKNAVYPAPQKAHRGRVRLALIAAGVIAAAIAGVYVAPRIIATRLQVHERGYEDAIAILKQEAGAAAVDKHIVNIPKRRLRMPYRSRITLGFVSPRHASYLFLNNIAERPYLLFSVVEDSSNGHAGSEVSKVAYIDRETAARIWATVTYLQMATAKENVVVDCEPVNKWMLLPSTFNCTWGRRFRPMSVDITHARAWDVLRKACIIRYVQGIAASDEFRYSVSPQDVQPALAAAVDTMMPLLSYADEHALDWYATRIARAGTDADLPILHRIEAFRSLKDNPTWQYRIPLVSAVLGFTLEGYRYPNVRDSVRFLESLQGKSDAERLATVRELAFGEDMASRSAWDARTFLWRNWPDEWTKLFSANFGRMNNTTRASYSRAYSWYFPNSIDSATLLASDPSPQISARGCGYLYLVNKDPALIDRLKKIAFATDAPKEGDDGREDAQFWLSELSKGGAPVGDLPAQFMEHFEMIEPWCFGRVFAQGEEKDITALLGFVESTDTIPSGLVESTDTAPSGLIESSDKASLGVAESTDTAPPGMAESTDKAPSGLANSTDTVASVVVNSTDTAPGADAQHLATVRKGVWPALTRSGNTRVANVLLDRVLAGWELPKEAIPAISATAGPDSLEKLQAAINRLNVDSTGVAANVDSTSAASDSRDTLRKALIKTALRVRLSSADDPAAFAMTLSDDDFTAVAPWLTNALANHCSRDKLQAVLADDAATRLSGYVIIALALQETSQAPD